MNEAAVMSLSRPPRRLAGVPRRGAACSLQLELTVLAGPEAQER